MLLTYSPLLRYGLIGAGDQAGVWSNTPMTGSTRSDTISIGSAGTV
jgi:hypothetical protein